MGASCGCAIEAVFRSWNSDRAARLPAEGGHPGRPRDGRDGPGDGLRQPRRDLGDRRPVHARTRRPASRRSTATSCSTPRARTSSPARIGPSRSRSSTSACPAVAAELREHADRPRAPLRATCATSSSRSRTAGSGCSRSGSASAARRRRSGSRVDMAEDAVVPADPRRAPSSGSRRCSPIRRRRRAPAAAPSVPLATGLPASPGHGERPDRHDPRGRRGSPPTRAGRRSSSGPRPRPTTSTGWPGRPAS